MQEKILFPSLDRLNDYLVLTVRGTSDPAPGALTVSNAARLWLRSEGTGYTLYTYDTLGTEVRLVHHHANLSLLDLFSVVEGALYFNGSAMATAASVAQRVRSVNGLYPDAAGAVTLAVGLNQAAVDARIEELAAPKGYVPEGMVKSVNGATPDTNGNVTVTVSGGLSEAQVDARIDAKTAALNAASHTHTNKNTLDNIEAVIEAAAMRNAIIFGGE